MITSVTLKRTVAAGAALALLAASGPTRAAELCFTGFGGSVHYQFETTAGKLRTPGERVLVGRVFGALASCAGLKEWPIIGTSISDSGTLILGFRTMTVDAGGCGAVDNIVSLNPNSLSGSLQLHNDRNNFSNSTTFLLASCQSPSVAPSLTDAVTDGSHDQHGN